MNTAVSSDTTGGTSQSSVLKNRNAMFVVLFVVLLVIVFLILLLVRATEKEQLNSVYGKRHGVGATDSVNGTGVLAKVFDERGFDVATWKRLSPKLNNFDTVVWFPDSFAPPTDDEREWFENWLQQPYRTLVYVGRDYDAMTAYLEMILPTVPAADHQRLQKLLDEAKSRHTTNRSTLQDQGADWFHVSRGESKHKVNSLQGAWSDGVDGSKSWIEIESQIEPASNDRDTRILLRSGQSDVLAMKVTDWSWGRDSKIIVVTNGSFLLNVSLVNREHRKLASKLIDECGAPGDVAFLESETGGLPIYETEPAGDKPTWEALATVWPFGPILMQCAALGIIVCFAMAPIFGTARDPVSEDQSDFGKHIDALAKLLSRTQQRNYAQSRLSYYQDKVRRESGVAHAEQRKTTKVLAVEIRWEGATFATPSESAAQHQFEQQIAARKIGKIIGCTSGLGKIDVTIEVADDQDATRAIQTLLRQLRLDHRAKITTQRQEAP